MYIKKNKIKKFKFTLSHKINKKKKKNSKKGGKSLIVNRIQDGRLEEKIRLNTERIITDFDWNYFNQNQIL